MKDIIKKMRWGFVERKLRYSRERGNLAGVHRHSRKRGNLVHIALFLSLLFSPCIYAADVQEFTLKNGLKLFVKEDHRAPLVATQVWYKVGSGDEVTGHTGISHLLEHMMFKGTEKYPQGELDKIIARHGGTQNAFTSSDMTAYIQKMPSDQLDISFELEADRMANLKMQQEAFDKELQVVLEERRMRYEDNPQALTYERFLAAAYIANPYHNPTIGWMDDIKQVTRDQAYQWYKNWYAPNNAIIVVVGDVNPKDVDKLAEKYFGKIKPTKIARRLPDLSLKPLGKRELVVKAPAKLSWLVMGYNVPHYTKFEKSWEPYALIVLAGILDGGKSARLEKDLIREKRIALEISASFSPYKRYGTLFKFTGVPAKDVTPKQLEEAIISEINQLKKELVTEQELSRVKAQAVAEHVYEKDSMSGQAFEIGGLEIIGLSWREGEEFPKKIEAVTAEQVHEVAKKYLVEDRLTVAILEPLPIENGKEIPETFKPGVHNHVH